MSSRWSDAVRHALNLRLGLWYAGLFAVSAGALLVATYVLLGQALATQDHDVVAAMLSRYSAEYARGGLDGLVAMIEADQSEGRHERVLVRVAGPEAEIAYFAQPPDWTVFDLNALDTPRDLRAGWTTLAGTDGSVAEVGLVALPEGVTIQVGRSSRVRDELLAHFRSRAAEVGGLLFVAAILGGLIIAHTALAPVRAMEATVAEILETGRLDARVPTRGSHDPLDRLGARINTMLGRIAVLMAGMRGALDNVAHDLRTPLTRLRNAAESALVKGDDAAVRDALGRAVEEADRVSATLTALMDISQAETGTMALRREDVRLAPIVDEAVALYADEADDRQIAVATDVEPGLTVHADATRLRQALANLVENAVKYTDRGGRVEVSGVRRDGIVAVIVRDTGIGIAPADLGLIWDRLYRADASRSTRGLGLGLSLVKAIVEAHGGHVGVSSVVGKGSAFSIELPAGAGPEPAEARS